MKSAEKQELNFFKGKELTFTGPDGNTYTIREQNGDDDEIVSSNDTEKRPETIANLNRLIASIMLQNTLNGKNYLTLEEIGKMKLRVKYYILLKTRINTIGSSLKFSAICPNKDCKDLHGKRTETKYSEDLNKYDTDLTNFDKEAKRYQYQITPYTSGKDTTGEFTLASGKRIRFTWLNVEAEQTLAKSKTISENTDFYIRNLEVRIPATNEWQLVSSCNIFSKIDMMELSKIVEENDMQFQMFMELKCPKCEREWEIPFLYLKDFFFPREI